MHERKCISGTSNKTRNEEADLQKQMVPWSALHIVIPLKQNPGKSDQPWVWPHMEQT